MRIGKREQDEKKEIAIPTKEFENYRLAQAAESEMAGKINGLQARLGSLTEQAENLQGQLAEARDRKAKAIEALALGQITQVGYDSIKAEIAKIHESIEETGEQIAVIERTLSNVSRDVLKASEAARGAKWAVIQAYVDKEAAEIRELVGAKVKKLCCLAGQTGVGDYGRQLQKVFPGMDLNERGTLTEQAMKELFESAG